MALAPAEAFGRVQSKIEFARLLDELGAPQPRWWIVRDGTEDDGAAEKVPYPYFLKTAFSTAGRGVRAGRTVAAYSVTQQAIARLGEPQP